MKYFLIIPTLFFIISNARAESMRDLTTQAIRDGFSSGILDDSVAELVKKTTKTDAPIYAEIKVAKQFQQEGCARLQITIKQEGVPLVKGGVDTMEIPFFLNMCIDGSAPQEGIDLSKFAE